MMRGISTGKIGTVPGQTRTETTDIGNSPERSAALGRRRRGEGSGIQILGDHEMK